ncbi:MAG TPA: CapA family protein, partial [Geobacteraceae bacterium]|nr:CapA family protein [Geobacteraceae bacterium]
MNEKHSRPIITIFLCGDVMTGRGIDQILPHPSDPRIHEPYVRDARRYVDLAEEHNGQIPRPAAYSYIWGDALAELERSAAEVRIINLETSITRSEKYWQGKGINYRMNPDNMPVITTAGINVCSLANNHVLDWGYEGLAETLQTLKKAKVKGVGAGRNAAEAEAPAVIDIKGKGRVMVFSFGLASSGIPSSWAAASDSPGVNLLPDLSDRTVQDLKAKIHRVKQPGAVVIASIHWGGNWGYAIPREHKEFAHKL